MRRGRVVTERTGTIGSDRKASHRGEAWRGIGVSERKRRKRTKPDADADADATHATHATHAAQNANEFFFSANRRPRTCVR